MGVGAVWCCGVLGVGRRPWLVPWLLGGGCCWVFGAVWCCLVLFGVGCWVGGVVGCWLVLFGAVGCWCCLVLLGAVWCCSAWVLLSPILPLPQLYLRRSSNASSLTHKHATTSPTTPHHTCYNPSPPTKNTRRKPTHPAHLQANRRSNRTPQKSIRINSVPFFLTF